MGNQQSKDAAIRQMLDNHVPWVMIAQVLKCSRERISMVSEGLEINHQMGRPRTLTPEMETYIDVNSALNAELTDQELCDMVAAKWPNNAVSRRTMARIRKDLGYNFRPKLTVQAVSEDQRIARMEFVNWVCSQPPELFVNIVFSDESRFCAEPDNSWVHVKRGCWNETALRSVEKFYQSTMVWAAIGPKYKSSMMSCSNKVDQQEYRDILTTSGLFTECNAQFGAGNWTFMQDGAPCHTAQKTIEFIRDRCLLLPGWPPNSPDLNPIELLWAIVKKKLQKADYHTLDGLERAAREVHSKRKQSTDCARVS
jgi:hypothetical protein